MPPREQQKRSGCAFLPVACDRVDATVVPAEGDVESNDSVAGLDELQVLMGDTGLGSCAVVEELDLLEEPRLLVRVELRSEVGRVDARLGREGLR
jgi:hypothetical protein